MNADRAAIIRRHAQELDDHDARERRNTEFIHKFHAARSGFRVRASLMFNVPVADVAAAQYAAAVQRTEQDTMPRLAP